jgi:hypothetical protein
MAFITMTIYAKALNPKSNSKDGAWSIACKGGASLM